MLKERWQMAICTASTLDDTSDARMPVAVVPMFAPSVSGSICSRLSEEESGCGMNLFRANLGRSSNAE